MNALESFRDLSIGDDVLVNDERYPGVWTIEKINRHDGVRFVCTDGTRYLGFRRNRLTKVNQ